MKKISKFLCITTALISTNLFANSICSDKHGTLHCGAGAIDNIEYRGYVDIDGTTVTNKFNVNGEVSIQNANINQFFVRGSSHLTKANIKGSMEVIGNIHAKNSEIFDSAKIVGDLYGNAMTFNSSANIVGTIECEECLFKSDVTMIGDVSIAKSQFLKKLLLNAKNSTFSNAKINDVLVKKPSQDEVQTVHLNENTTVHNIKFENQKGIVVLQGGSKILGTIEGGKVVTKNTNI